MKTNGKQEGQVLVFAALTIVVLLGITGLAIDGGIAYGVRAKLSSALDAATIAAADATGDSSGGYAAAIAAGKARFNANFPSGYLKATPSVPTISVLPNTPKAGEITVNATASATAPTYFMQVLGLNTVNASSTAQAVKHDLDMVLVIDNTGSLDPVGSSVISAALSFIKKFNPATDRVGLIKFAYGANVVVPINTVARGFNQSAIESAISAMNFDGDTDYNEAFWDARAQLDSIPASSRSSSRVIVFFSDGSPNSFSATFNSSHPGIICSYDSPGTPFGIDKIGSLSAPNPPAENSGYSISSVTSLPAYSTWTNGGPTATTYQVAPNPPGYRPVIANYLNDPNDKANFGTTGGGRGGGVVNYPGFTSVNDAARNLAEEMADDARNSGIYVYTLGEGPALTAAKTWGPSGVVGAFETGDAVLKDMANDPTARTYNSKQPTGDYVYAADSTELQAAFDEIASALLRLTK